MPGDGRILKEAEDTSYVAMCDASCKRSDAEGVKALEALITPESSSEKALVHAILSLKLSVDALRYDLLDTLENKLSTLDL